MNSTTNPTACPGCDPLLNLRMAYGFNYGITKRLKRGSGGGRTALPVRSEAK